MRGAMPANKIKRAASRRGASPTHNYKLTYCVRTDAALLALLYLIRGVPHTTLYLFKMSVYFILLKLSLNAMPGLSTV